MGTLATLHFRFDLGKGEGRTETASPPPPLLSDSHGAKRGRVVRPEVQQDSNRQVENNGTDGS